ncbi:MAG TPA: hypothetical protein VFB81_01625 [Myxococcales bacterium]|nr:hypothetical protein [Myxococcales bacterium]
MAVVELTDRERFLVVATLYHAAAARVRDYNALAACQDSPATRKAAEVQREAAEELRALAHRIDHGSGP